MCLTYLNFPDCTVLHIIETVFLCIGTTPEVNPQRKFAKCNFPIVKKHNESVRLYDRIFMGFGETHLRQRNLVVFAITEKDVTNP